MKPPLHPVSAYARQSSRSSGRRLYGEGYGMRSVSLRSFNGAGADPSGEIGKEHEPETHHLPLAIDAALGQRGPLNTFGTDYPTPEGTEVRDYIHIVDLADAHVLALECLLNGGHTAALNFGTGQGHSVREVVDAVERASGYKVPRGEAARRAGDPPELVADASLAAQQLDAPPSSDLETIVKNALTRHQR